MSTTRSKSSTLNIKFKIISLSDVEKDTAEIKDLSIKVSSAILNAQTEYTIYKDQKTFTEKHVSSQDLPKMKSLFSSDFNDFKNALNAAIRVRNEFHEKFSFQLKILGKDHDFVKQVAGFDEILNSLKQEHEKEKVLYTSTSKEEDKSKTAPHTPSTTEKSSIEQLQAPYQPGSRK